MSFNLKGRHLLSLEEYKTDEIKYLIDLAQELKSLKKAGVRPKNLEGKNVALIFEKPSTRTRCAFVTATVDEGGHPEYLGKNDIQLGKKETVADTARVLGRMFDGIQFRGYKHETVKELAKYAGVPVWNGLTDKFHPTQILADLLTIKEKKGFLKGIKFAFVGDGRNNMANSLMIGAAKMGMDFRIVAPKELYPEQALVEKAKEIAKQTQGKITITDSVEDGVKNVDVIYTDVWVSMGEEDKFEQRISLLHPYQVNMNMLELADEEVIFMHCLPAFHNRETLVGEEIYQKHEISEMEVTEEVFESKYSVVFDEAENRLHTIKAVMVATIGK